MFYICMCNIVFIHQPKGELQMGANNKVISILKHSDHENSFSSQATDEIIKRAQARTNLFEYNCNVLENMVLPPVRDEYITIKSSGDSKSDDEKNAWAKIVELSDNLIKSDIWLFSLPMWNFGIPYTLKHYIDLITQQGLFFTYDENGPAGLMKNKSAILVISSGGIYKEEPLKNYDLSTAYLKLWLGFCGISDIFVVRVDGTAMPGFELEAILQDPSIDRAVEIISSQNYPGKAGDQAAAA